MTNKNKTKTTSHPAYKMVTIVSFIIPVAGILIGIIYLTKEKKEDLKLGEHAIATSLIAGILWATIIFFSSNIGYVQNM
jgi:threonine/homoserine efflux transporter RhtA